MTLVHAPDFVSFSDMPLLQSLTARKRPPNLLIVCADAALGAVLAQLQTVCGPPFHTCVLPGPLALPAESSGTLLLHDVASLTIDQQVALYDWMSERHDVQVVSVTGAPLLSFVQDGRFLEGLFYRLNTVCVVATGSNARWPRLGAHGTQITRGGDDDDAGRESVGAAIDRRQRCYSGGH